MKKTLSTDVHRLQRQVQEAAEEFIVRTAPSEWFNDSHDPEMHPRCCELRDAIVALTLGMMGKEIV